MTTHRKHLAQRQRQEEERVATRAAEKAAKPAEKKTRLKVVEQVAKAKDEKVWKIDGWITVTQATRILSECDLSSENADAFVSDFYEPGVVIFESDVRAWAEGRS